MGGEGETFTTASAGTYHTVGLTSAGRILAWGNDDYGQCSGVPALEEGEIFSNPAPQPLILQISLVQSEGVPTAECRRLCGELVVTVPLDFQPRDVNTLLSKVHEVEDGPMKIVLSDGRC